MRGLTNLQLEKLAQKVLGTNFLGVYPADAGPNITSSNNTSIIFNLSKHNAVGTHYVAIHFSKNKIFYFDSYGKKLTNKSILTYLKSFSLPIFYHTKSVQPPESIFCSLYSLGYLKAVQKMNKHPHMFFNLFPKKLTKTNDQIITRFLMEK